MICGLCVFLMGCPSLGAPFGYPRMWDYTRKEPTAASLAGTYHIRQVRTVDIGGASSTIQNFRNRQDVSVTINPDHMAILSNIPDFDICGGKEISTAATWKLLGNDWEIRFDAVGLTKATDAKSDPCGTGWNRGMYILGQAAPYRLWLGIGDPDGDTGIEFELNGRTK